MLIDVKKYNLSLKKLWSETFGDDEEYINLLFDKGYVPSECFAEVIDGEIVSALYLLSGYIVNGRQKYEGRYLYAAATDFRFRSKGIMSKLIKEALEYVKSNNISFVSLVPANEGLYGYYGKFGFEPLMKNYISTVAGENEFSARHKVSPADAFILRKTLNVPYFNFDAPELGYVELCLKYAGYHFFKITEDSYCIVSESGDEVLEYISSAENMSENTKNLLGFLNKGTTLVSPYDLSDYCECKENKFGMVFFVDENIKENFNDGIYMNIALN